MLKGLKNIRKSKGLSQLNVSEFLHISPSTVAQWELGEKHATAGQVLSLCKILGCLPSDLFLPQEKIYADSDSIIPVFSGTKITDVTFVPLPQNHPLSVCQFAVKVSHNISERIRQGDMCYFELCSSCSINDVVISVDADCMENIFIAEHDTICSKNIVAVCRFMQSRFL